MLQHHILGVLSNQDFLLCDIVFVAKKDAFPATVEAHE